MRWRTLVVLCLSLSFVAIGCDDDDEDGDSLSYNGTNGFAANGNGLSNVSVDTDFNSGSASMIFGSGAVSVTLRGSYEGDDAVINIGAQTPGSAVSTGSKSWGLGFGGQHTITVEIGGTTYRSQKGTSSTDGSTVYRTLSDETIEGTFDGTVEDTDGNSIRVVGKFSVEND